MVHLDKYFISLHYYYYHLTSLKGTASPTEHVSKCSLWENSALEMMRHTEEKKIDTI